MDELADLDLRVVTITEEPGSGLVMFNHDGMSPERALWLLESARFLMLSEYWYGEDDDEGDDED